MAAIKPYTTRLTAVVACALLLLQCARVKQELPELPVADTLITPGIERTTFNYRNLTLAPDGSVYGTQGRRLYRIVPGGDSTELIAEFEHRVNGIHITRSGVQVVATDDDHFDPRKAAKIFVSTDSAGHYRESLRLAGGSALAWSIDSNENGTIFVGEYGPQRKGMSKNVWASHDDGATWKVVFRAQDSDGVHIHRVAVDPISNSLWISVGDGAANRGVFVSASSDEIAFNRVLDSQATAIEFSSTHIYLGEDTRRRPGISLVERHALRSATMALKLKRRGNYGGSVYDMTIGGDGLVYAPTMKYHDQQHIAALWVGRGRDWTVAMLFDSVDGIANGRETIAGPDREGYIYVSGYKIHDPTVAKFFNARNNAR